MLAAFIARARTDADASACFYGVGIEQFVAEAATLDKPLMLHIAEEDQFVAKPAQEQIKAALKNHVGVEIFSYPGRDHAFARKGGEHYDAADAQLAEARTLDFFKKNLG